MCLSAQCCQCQAPHLNVHNFMTFKGLENILILNSNWSAFNSTQQVPPVSHRAQSYIWCTFWSAVFENEGGNIQIIFLRISSVIDNFVTWLFNCFSYKRRTSSTANILQAIPITFPLPFPFLLIWGVLAVGLYVFNHDTRYCLLFKIKQHQSCRGVMWHHIKWQQAILLPKNRPDSVMTKPN